jgi:hypothetical protein
MPKVKPLSDTLKPDELEMRSMFATSGSERELRGKMLFSVCSQSYSHSGLIEVEVGADGLNIRWMGEEEWQPVLWHDLVLFAGSIDKVWKENLEWERERAYNEMVVGLAMAEAAQADWNRGKMKVMAGQQENAAPAAAVEDTRTALDSLAQDEVKDGLYDKILIAVEDEKCSCGHNRKHHMNEKMDLYGYCVALDCKCASYNPPLNIGGTK